MKRSFADSLAIGRTGEVMVAERLERSGWFVIPSYEYTGSEGDKAPKMRRLGETHVVPDLDASKSGRRIWVEVKTKTKTSPCRLRGGVAHHGIDRRHWESYKKIEAETGCEVFLAIRELDTGSILIASIRSLEHNILIGVGRGSHMVYFPRSSFSERRQ